MTVNDREARTLRKLSTAELILKYSVGQVVRGALWARPFWTAATLPCGAANLGCNRLLAGSPRPRTPWFPSQETLMCSVRLFLRHVEMARLFRDKFLEEGKANDGTRID